MRALGDALAAQEEGLDPELLSRTYAALMAELQEAAGMGVHAVELTPATLAPVLPEGQQVDERRNAQLAELPEGLRSLAGEVRELAVRSTRLAVVPVWVHAHPRRLLQLRHQRRVSEAEPLRDRRQR